MPHRNDTATVRRITDSAWPDAKVMVAIRGPRGGRSGIGMLDWVNARELRADLNALLTPTCDETSERMHDKAGRLLTDGRVELITADIGRVRGDSATYLLQRDGERWICPCPAGGAGHCAHAEALRRFAEGKTARELAWLNAEAALSALHQIVVDEDGQTPRTNVDIALDIGRYRRNGGDSSGIAA